MITRKTKTLAQIIKEFFFGPVRVKAVKLEGSPSGVHYAPADQNAAKELRDLLGLKLSESPMIFGVAAFQGIDGQTYDVYARLRGKIIEVIPVFKLGMRRRGEWQPETILNPFELEFERVEGRKGWQSRHPATGQHIRVFDMELQPEADGKARVHPSELVLRPALTRTFWLAGQEGVIGRLTDNAIEVYEDTAKEDFSYAPCFVIMGRWRSPWECLGDPTGGVIELGQANDGAGHKVDLNKLFEVNFRQTLEEMIKGFEHWRGHVFFPTLHPDRYEQDARYKAMDPTKQQSLREITDETRQQSVMMIDWVRRWADWFVADLLLRGQLGMSRSRKLPQPFLSPGETPRKPPKKLLVNMTKEDIEAMLFKPAKEPMVLKPKARKPAKTAIKPPTTDERQAELAGRKGRQHKDAITETPPANGGATIGDLIPATTKAKMEEVAGNGPNMVKCKGCDDFVIVPNDWQGEISSCDQHDRPKGKKARKRLLVPKAEPPVEQDPPKKARQPRAEKAVAV